MKLQLYGLTFNFLGTILLLLFSDPLMTEREIRDKGKILEEKIIRHYLMKRYFALIVIVAGFIILVISFLR